MASFRKRGERWQVQVRRLGHPSFSRSFHSKTDAVRWAREAERQVDRGELASAPGAARTTVRDLLLRYAREVSPTQRGCHAEQPRLKAIARGSWTASTPDRLTTPLLAAWRDSRLAEVGSGTVLRELGLVRRVLVVARNEWGCRVDLSVFDRLSRPKAPPHRSRRLMADEEQYLRTACGAARNKYLLPAIELAIETAMRRGELLAVEWADVDLSRGLLRVRIGKNGKGRIVPLSQRAQEVVQQLAKRPEGARVLPTSAEALKLAFRRAVARARQAWIDQHVDGEDNRFLVDLHFHDLRHEATTRLFELGLNTMEVASVTGHETLQMLRRYTHLRPEDLLRKVRQVRPVV